MLVKYPNMRFFMMKIKAITWIIDALEVELLGIGN